MAEWFHSWFDSSYYHLLYQHRDDLEAEMFIKRLFPEIDLAPNRKILDLACGKGRHAQIMNKMGHFVTGIDLSKSNIEEANRISADDLEFFVHDMRQAFREGFYDLITNLFTSFGYFETIDEHARVIENIRFNLAEGGHFILDYLNPPYVKKHLVEREQKKINGIDFTITRGIEEDVVVKRIEVDDSGRKHFFEERVRLFSHVDFLKLFSEFGFEVIDVWGNYDLSELRRSSPRQIIYTKSIV